ncbi:MAG: hypothetical protein WBV94_22525 [Blastocatellia bacterium]
MSATATQERLAKTTSWLAQLKGNAEHAGFTATDAAQKAQERYGKPLDELTVTEAQTLAWEYSDISKQKAEAARAALTPQNGSHSHPCFQCDGPVPCNRPDCRETELEHGYCHVRIYSRRMGELSPQVWRWRTIELNQSRAAKFVTTQKRNQS